MEGAEGRFDADTLKKIELINKKIDEINQRKIGIHTTRIEDDLDRQELDAYIKNMQLTDRQRAIIDRYNRNNDASAAARNDWILFIVMGLSIFLQLYIGLEVYRLITKGTLETADTIYLAFLIMFFTFNTFQIIRFFRVTRRT